MRVVVHGDVAPKEEEEKRDHKDEDEERRVEALVHAACLRPGPCPPALLPVRASATQQYRRMAIERDSCKSTSESLK